MADTLDAAIADGVVDIDIDLVDAKVAVDDGNKPLSDRSVTRHPQGGV